MSEDTPLATLRIASPELDSFAINRIMLNNKMEGLGFGLGYNELFWLEISERRGSWLATTEFFNSFDPSRHLSYLVNVWWRHHEQVYASSQDVAVSFSLLVFDQKFSPDLLPEILVSKVLRAGSFSIELPSQNKEIVFSEGKAKEFVI